jgi:type II secretory pathway predicted ATPase ExeA
MYEAFFGLSSRPFAEHPDPDFFVDSDARAASLRALHDGIGSQHPILVITGETGCGKTMLALKLLQELDADTTIGFIPNPLPAVPDLTRWALLSFGLEVAGLSDADLQEALTLYIIAEYAEGRRCLLVVDEAQNLSPAALAGLHRLLDLNGEGDCLLQVLLIAQPQLLQTLRDPSLAAWAERTPLVCFAGPLAADDVALYVRSRLAVARAPREILTERAIAAIAAASGGVPRLINALCETALTFALSQQRTTVDRDLIAEVADAGRAAGFGSLAMLTPLGADSPAEAAVMAEPILEDAALEEAIAAEGTAPPPDVPEEMGSVALFLAEEAPTATGEPEPAIAEAAPPPAVLPQAEAPAPPGGENPADTEPEHHQLLVAWPSISGRQDFARPAALRAGAGMPNGPLRRRFLPRD